MGSVGELPVGLLGTIRILQFLYVKSFLGIVCECILHKEGHQITHGYGCHKVRRKALKGSNVTKHCSIELQHVFHNFLLNETVMNYILLRRSKEPKPKSRIYSDIYNYTQIYNCSCTLIQLCTNIHRNYISIHLVNNLYIMRHYFQTCSKSTET